MSCCGNKRNEYSGKSSAGDASERPFYKPAARISMQEDMWFEYTGETGLTVTGTVTGKQYRFERNGDTQWVHHKDVGGMMAVPAVKKVENKN